jgi:hypothetical protein
MILQPPATILCGETGTGKTSALATLARAGIETFLLSTEAGGVESFIDACTRLKVDMNLVHWNAATPKAAGWDGLEDMIKKISHMDQQGLASQTNMGKANHEQAALNFLGQMKDFECQRTGQLFGDITRWGPDRAFCIDSLTGWSAIAWGCTVGHKPTASPGEWGIGQNFIYFMLKKIIADRNCFFVLTSHLEKENDELTGVKKITVSTLGAKLAPKIPVEFSEVVMTKKTVDQKTGLPKFSWSTLENNAALKNRALPISSNLDADFKPIVEAYQRRLQAAGMASQQPSPQATTQTPPATVMPVAPATPQKPAA